MLPLCHRKAGEFQNQSPCEVDGLIPTTWPQLLMSPAELNPPPSEPKYRGTPACQSTARGCSNNGRQLVPTACPLALAADAVLWSSPGSGGRAIRVPLCQRNRLLEPSESCISPTTCPASLMSVAWL